MGVRGEISYGIQTGIVLLGSFSKYVYIGRSYTEALLLPRDFLQIRFPRTYFCFRIIN